MKAGTEHAAWLADRERCLSSKRVGEDWARQWNDHPLFSDLRADLAAIDRNSAAAVLRAADRFMDRSADLEALFSSLIALASAYPFLTPPLAATVTEINTGYLLFADMNLTISIGVIGRDALAAKKLAAEGTTAIPFTGLLTSYRFLKSGGATLSFWEAPPVTSDFVGDVARSCRFEGRRRIEDREALLLDGRSQSLVIEHLASDMLCLQASVQIEAAPLSVDYDSRTLHYLGATSTDEASSRTQMMVTLLRLMDRTDAMPVIEGALASPHFYTRWHVMREMLALDADGALPHLRRLARSDPHPEVRFAAVQALSLFFNEEAEEMLQCRA
jgi:hypothetical protein